GGAGGRGGDGRAGGGGCDPRRAGAPGPRPCPRARRSEQPAWRGAVEAVGSKGRPYRRLEACGFEILVGKGDAENDRLTFEIAEPHDWWLHVAATSASPAACGNPNDLTSRPVP